MAGLWSTTLTVHTLFYDYSHHLDYCKVLNPELRQVVKLLRGNLYVDDFLTGADTVKKGEEIYTKSKEIICLEVALI